MSTRYPYYLETDDEVGEVHLMQDGIIIAHSKSRNAMAKIRDALNAPCPLEGAWVTKQNDPTSMSFHLNPVQVGVVQSVAYAALGGFMLLVRTDDNTLEAWSTSGVSDIRVIDKPNAKP